MKTNTPTVLCVIAFAFTVFQCSVSKKGDSPSTGQSLANAQLVKASLQNLAEQPPLPRDSAGRIIVDQTPDYQYRSIQESMNAIYVPEGYRLQLVASEPAIKEPVAVVWDGNGRMYVAEMRTYMQDIDATQEDEPWSRISLHEDSDGDGIMDKHSVYIDSLVLPRMMLCIGKKLVVSETYDYSMYAYEDTDGDGVADTKEKIFDNPKRSTANLEHQRSGLVWNLDNYIYVTAETVRYKYKNGKLVTDSLAYMPFQWGLAKDDFGRLFFSSAGYENPAFGFQVNPLYGQVDFPGQLSGDFIEVWPLISTPDVQGGLGRLRADSTLNHFTGNCGHSVYRGDALPADLKGDLIICEPVGRLIRRAEVLNVDGKRILKNVYDKEEFIASTDPNFRPVNSATGPDGFLYIVDMHRGIIQEGNWTKEGSFLRPQILSKGLDKNVSRGRIYRLIPDDFDVAATKRPQPRFLDLPASELPQYLSHPNGWWRDNAQKEMIVRNDHGIVPDLIKIAREDSDPLTRIHALWTLDGLQAMAKYLILEALADPSAEIRKTALLLSESYIRNNDTDILGAVYELKKDSDPDVLIQLTATLSHFRPRDAEQVLSDIQQKKKHQETLQTVSAAVDKSRNARLYGTEMAKLSEPHRKVVLEGREIFQQVCAACHGADGKGVSIAGSEIPAPSFVHSARIKNKKSLINILLHGLTGPIDGKTYPDVMAPFGAANSDQWVASVVSYMQHQFKDRDQKIEPVKPEEVKSLRAANANRNKPWTIQELEGSSPNGPSVDKPVASKSAASRSVDSKTTESKSVGKSAVSKPAKKSLTGPTGKGSSVPSSGSIKNSKEVALGKTLIQTQDCKTCHLPDRKLIGPSYSSIAAKYPRNAASVRYLSEKIIKGGAGVWGNIPMTPHPSMSNAQASAISHYILSLPGSAGAD